MTNPDTDRVVVGNLRVAQSLYDFITNEALPGTGIDPESFWAGADKVIADLTPRNQELLARRDELQAQIDRWHRQRIIGGIDPGEYAAVPDRYRLSAAGPRGLHHHPLRSRCGDHLDRRARSSSCRSSTRDSP